MKRVIAIIFCVFIIAGCGVKHKYKAADGINQAIQICIVNNPATKEGFQNTMVSWLKRNNYEVKLLPQGSNLSECEWTLTYYGKWSWDATIYLSDAEIIAYHNGQRVAESKFHVSGGAFSFNPNKYGAAESRVQTMMSNLFDKNK